MKKIISLFQRDFKNNPQFVLKVKHEWHEQADPKLIEKSAYQLLHCCKGNESTNFFLPRVGCGNGSLNWEETVEPIIKSILHPLPNIIIVHPSKG